MSDPLNEPFFAAVGRLTLSWAHLEFGLDAAISVIHMGLKGHTVEPEVPIHIGRKVKYIKRCLRRLEPLAGHQERILPLMQQIATAVEFRKSIVHGCISTFPAQSEQVEMMRLLHDKGGMHEMKPFTVTTEMVNRATCESNQLARQVTSFSIELIEIFLK